MALSSSSGFAQWAYGIDRFRHVRCDLYIIEINQAGAPPFSCSGRWAAPFFRRVPHGALHKTRQVSRIMISACWTCPLETGLAGWGGKIRTCASESEPLNPTNLRIEMRKFESCIPG